MVSEPSNKAKEQASAVTGQAQDVLPPSAEAAAGWVRSPGADLCHNWMRVSLERLLKYLTVDDLTQLTVKRESIPGDGCMKER